MDDLIIVPVLHRDMSKARAWNDLEISLDRDTQGIKAEQVHHLGNARPTGDAPVLAVDSNRKAAVETH